MESKIQDQFIGLADSLAAYMPNLIGGIILLLLGWLAGWVIKRILVQLSVLLRIDRFITRSKYQTDFSKADVRYSLYNLIGNIGYLIVFLIFLDNALLTWKLNILSDLLSKGILFLPKIIIALVIFGLGWLLASWVQLSLLKALRREDVPRASLIVLFVKGILMVFITAIALVELDIAREIVIVGFATIFITLGSIAVVFTATGGRNFLQKLTSTFTEEKKENQVN
jgi:hypothetical protein